MRIKKLTDNPILAIGILFMAIFLMTQGKNFMQKYFPGYKQRLTPTSCRALMVKLSRRIPANWQAQCNKNNLAVVIDYKLPKEVSKEKKLTWDQLKALSYRELANSYVHIAKNSPSDNLERTDIVSIRFKNEFLEINSISEGKFVVKLSTLTRKEMIQQHFHATVQVQEVPLKKFE